jgi:hypothetical protein
MARNAWAVTVKKDSHIWVEVLVACLQIVAAIGWVLVWVVGPYALGGSANTSGTRSWEFGAIAINFAVVVLGWPLCLFIAWLSYCRSKKTNSKSLVILSSLPYLHLAILAAGICLLWLLGVIE